MNTNIGRFGFHHLGNEQDRICGNRYIMIFFLHIKNVNGLEPVQRFTRLTSAKGFRLELIPGVQKNESTLLKHYILRDLESVNVERMLRSTNHFSKRRG